MTKFTVPELIEHLESFIADSKAAVYHMDKQEAQDIVTHFLYYMDYIADAAREYLHD